MGGACGRVCGMFGCLPGLCDHQMSVGVFVRRFKDAFFQVMARHGITSQHDLGIRHMKSFGFGNQSGLTCSRQLRHPDEVLIWALRLSGDIASLDHSRLSKPLAAVFPCWDGITPGD